MNKPENIYTTEETTTKKFEYGKPEGWDKKKTLPIINPKEFKMKWWMIIRDVWRGREDIEPKYLMRYDGWLHELKTILMTIFFMSCLTYMLFHSSLVTTSASNEDNDRETFFDKGMDYVLGKYDEWKYGPIIAKPDTIYQVKKDTIAPMIPLLTQEQLDSIINSYNQRLDSLKAADSTAKIE